MFSSARPGNSNPKQRAQTPTASPSSSSASSCPSPPPLSPPEAATSAAVAATPTSTMEELWRDINPSPLHHPHNHHAHHHHGHGHPSSSAAARHAMIFQDFLGPPPPTAAMLVHPGGHYHPGSHSMLASAAADPPPATLLSLNSGMEFHFMEGSSPLQSSSGSGHLQSGLTNVVSSASFNNGWPFEAALANSAPVLPCFAPKKRTNDPETGTGDRRHKRMIKNRESAARSRARKQAYTNELELEVAHLNEENAKLRKQNQQLCMAAGVQVAKKHSLQRSATAPF